ncbi:Mediator of RNA polymerase II transcription subunit 22 - like 1 [Theobroma cacao]|nr:Mediator of RNA polymerase II transcription subunit 22 - like 1 [Theobroma cacao]
MMQRVETDIVNIVDNFTQLVNVARVNDPPVRNSQEAFMMEMRAARMVQAADSLLKLVSELKQTAIFSGFASLNDHVEQRIPWLMMLHELGFTSFSDEGHAESAMAPT